MCHHLISYFQAAVSGGDIDDSDDDTVPLITANETTDKEQSSTLETAQLLYTLCSGISSGRSLTLSIKVLRTIVASEPDMQYTLYHLITNIDTLNEVMDNLDAIRRLSEDDLRRVATVSSYVNVLSSFLCHVH